jgi:Amidase
MSASTRDRWRASAAPVQRRVAHRRTDQVQWTALRARVQHALGDFDALLWPSTLLPTLPVETTDASLVVYTEHNLQYLRNATIGNVFNLCGLSTPCGFTSQRFPIGLTIYDKPFQEDLVLRSRYTFEQAPDRHRRTLDLSWVYGWSAFLGVLFPLPSTRQREHDLSKNACAGHQIRRGSRLGFVVTDPAPARHEQHAAGTEVGHVLGVMRRARNHIHMH